MARVIADGEVKINWVVTISAVTQPTTTEISAGTEVTPYLQSLDTPLDGDAVDASDLSTAFNKSVAGTFGGGASADMYRDDTTDTAYAAFPRNTTGYMVIRRFGGSDTAWAAADEVEVWPLRVITRSPSTMDRNTVQMFSVDFATLDEPTLNAVVT